MAIYVVSFQAFKSIDNQFMLKEFAIASVHSDATYQWTIRPQVPLNTMSTEMQRRVQYLTDKVHGIPWFSGANKEEAVLDVVRDILKDASVIYIKGSERAKYMRDLLGDFPEISILDIDDYKAVKYARKNPEIKCRFAGGKHQQLRCAYEQAVRYRDAIRTTEHSGESEEDIGGRVT